MYRVITIYLRCYMKKILKMFGILSILFVGCTTTEYLNKGNVSFTTETDKKNAMDAIVYVLSEHGITVSMINESFGLIQTDWKQTSDMEKNLGTTILLGALAGGSNTYFYEYLKMDFRVTDTGYTVSPLYKQEQQKRNAFANSSATAVNKAPVKTSEEGQIVLKIVEEINSMLNINGEIIWE